MCRCLAPIASATRPAYFGGAHLQIYKTPLRWLQSGCAGAAIIDPNGARFVLRRAIGPVAGEDLDHAQGNPETDAFPAAARAGAAGGSMTAEFAPLDDERHGKTRRGAPDILRGTDFADMSTISAKRWLVHHLLAFGEVAVLYGEPGSGKSVLAEDIGLHVAAGMAWHDRTVKQSAVLYVALERAGVVARRALAFAKEHNLEQARLPFTMVRGPLDFRDPNVARLIVATVADLAKRYDCEPGLVIVDTVSRALCGGDENSPKDMGQLIANLGRIQGDIDIHLLLTHHQPAEKERMRGHGALLGAVDTTIHVTKTTTGRLAEVVKSSDFEEGQRIAFSLHSVTIDQDEYGEAVTAPVVVEETASVAPKAKAKAAGGRARWRSMPCRKLPTTSALSRQSTAISRRLRKRRPWINGATTPTGSASADRPKRIPGRRHSTAP